VNRSALFLLAIAFVVATCDAVAGREADRLYEHAVRRHADSTPTERFSLYARAAEEGHAVAQYNVAMMYANGEAVNVDYQQAVYWFRKSADQRFAPAQLRLGELYYFGMGGLPVDRRHAARLFEAAASQGDPDACLDLAIMLGSGDVLPLDPARARAMLDRAANGGNESAEEYREMLDAAPDGRFTAVAQDAFWRQQKQFWVDMAAQFGVRDAEEAVGGRKSER